MRKGLRLTLSTVAIALLGLRAMAVAPTISDLPDVIVGDAENTSADNIFVSADILNLDDYVEDELSSDSSIIWYYEVSDQGTTAGTYLINGKQPFDFGTDDPVNPPAAKQIQASDTDPYTGGIGQDGNAFTKDSDPFTITIRDNQFSPINGTAPFPDPAGGPGLVHSAVVTLFASDGSTVSELGEQMLVFTIDDAYDGFSVEETPPGPDAELVYQRDFTQDTSGWQYLPIAGTATQSTAQGLCITVPGPGYNDGRWVSTYGDIQLVANSVWDARIKIATDVTAQGATPLWQFGYDNSNATTGANTAGQDEYYGEIFFIDQEGGANSPLVNIGHEDFRVFMAPISFQVPWFQDGTTGFFSADWQAKNDMRMYFRIIDDAVSGGWLAQNDAGMLCMETLTVYRHDFADAQMGTALIDDTNIVNGATNPATGWQLDETASPPALDDLDAVFANGNATLQPTGGTLGTTISVFGPGDSTVPKGEFSLLDAGSQADDNYPLTWESDKVYYIEFMLSAVNEHQPPASIRVGAEVYTDEVVNDHAIIPNTPDNSIPVEQYPQRGRGLSMPREGQAAPYAAMWYSHQQSMTGIPGGAVWRPRLDVINAPNVLAPFGRTTEAQYTGQIVIESIKVTEITNW